VAFSGQFELLEHANKLKLMVPMTVMIIFILLYLAFRRAEEAVLILMSLPFALVGGSGSSTGRVSYVGGDRYRVYRAGRGRGRVWRGDADVFAPRR
jgi:tetrahydromethanopterin S-methyltransferase subunit E